jgi:chloride channel 7
MSISSGIFIPTLLTGAAWGRIVGTLLYRCFPDTDWGDVGKYSLIGASAQLSGTIRLTYSLTAIILEATGWCYVNSSTDIKSTSSPRVIVFGDS